MQGRAGTGTARRAAPQAGAAPADAVAATAALAPHDEALVAGFLERAWSELGLADNTLHAYRRDIEDLDRYFRARSKTIIKASADDYRKYLHDQTRSGQSTKTVARRIAAMRVSARRGRAGTLKGDLATPERERKCLQASARWSSSSCW